MVIAIVEPVFAGLLVSLLNNYILSGQCTSWLQQSCECSGEIIDEDEWENEEEEDVVSSTTTTISDASVHIHCH